MARDGRVLVCDSHRELLALDPTSGALSTLVESINGRQLKFCSNVTETADGTIYFTESTSRFRFEHFDGAIMEARGTGGLYRLSTDGSVATLVEGLYFANGVTVTADGSALVFAETQGRRLSKYWLTGPQAGTATPLAVNLPGMPDNISTGSDGRIWVAMVSPIIPAAERLAPLAPHCAGCCGGYRNPCCRKSSPRCGWWRSTPIPDELSAVSRCGTRTSVSSPGSSRPMVGCGCRVSSSPRWPTPISGAPTDAAGASARH